MRGFRLAAGAAALTAVVAAIDAGSAHAGTFNLDLTGAVADYTPIPGFDSGGFHFDNAFLPLSGLDGANAVTLSQGDTVNATLTLDGPLTVPGSVTRTGFTFWLFGSQFPDEDTAVGEGTTTFSSGGTQVAQLFSGTSTHGALALGSNLFPPDNGPITFDTVTFSFTIDNLATPATVDSAEFDTTLVSPSPTPEPAAWALMLLGFGGLGAALRARRRSQVLA